MPVPRSADGERAKETVRRPTAVTQPCAVQASACTLSNRAVLVTSPGLCPRLVAAQGSAPLPQCVFPRSANAQAISVAEYAAVFFQRVVKNEYNDDDAENAREAGKAFVGARTLQLHGRGKVVAESGAVCSSSPNVHRWC